MVAHAADTDAVDAIVRFPARALFVVTSFKMYFIKYGDNNGEKEVFLKIRGQEEASEPVA